MAAWRGVGGIIILFCLLLVQLAFRIIITERKRNRQTDRRGLVLFCAKPGTLFLHGISSARTDTMYLFSAKLLAPVFL